jgi:hypothetical protein
VSSATRCEDDAVLVVATGATLCPPQALRYAAAPKAMSAFSCFGIIAVVLLGSRFGPFRNAANKVWASRVGCVW